MAIEQYRKKDRLLVAVDCIILGFDGRELKALLVQRQMEPQFGDWSLMGGFVNENESLDAAATRVLDQLTGLSSIYMEQLYSFGDVERDPGGRVISVAYFALIKIADHNQDLAKSHNAKWYPLHELPNLIFDHQHIMAVARERLKQKVANQPIGFLLLPKEFTLQQLQALYEAVYEKKIDKRNFARKISSLDILRKLDKKEKLSSKKGAFYYVFNKTKYAKLESEGFRFFK